jgi:hypothetical protein
VYFGGLGAVRGRVWNQAGKKMRFPAIPSRILEVISPLVPYFLQVFFSACSGTLRFVALGDLEAQR